MNSNKPIKPGLLPMSRQENDLLQKLYLQQDLSAGEIADRLSAPGASVSERTIFNRLAAHGITKPGSRAHYKAPKFCPHCQQKMPKKVKQSS